ncbi:MAG: protein jag [Chloroflexi bacterium]|nr:protein jag [Chloroflexota bacterium]
MTAKTAEEAIELALKQLGAQREDVVIEVISKGKTGILGFGSEPARVRVVRLDPTQTLAKEAKEVVDKLLVHMKVNAIASIGPPPQDSLSSIAINVEGEDSGLLIGRRGETLQALQFIVASLLSHTKGEGVRVHVDVEHYKDRRRAALQKLAQNMAERVSSSGRPMTLEPMPPAERRIIHMTLANDRRVTTQSVGDREGRKVTILPRRGSSGTGPSGARLSDGPQTLPQEKSPQPPEDYDQEPAD